MSSRKHEVPNELLSSLLAKYKISEDLIGEDGLLKQCTKLLAEKALDAEKTEHLGHEKHEPVANGAGNPATAAVARRSRVSSASLSAIGADCRLSIG